MENNLDIKDTKILKELDKNARQSNNQIGKKVGLSKEVVKYRIDRMINDRIILRFHTVINYFKLGIVKYKLYLRLINIDKQELEKIANYFNQHNKTEWVVITTGRWDLIIGFLVKNVNEFDDEVIKSLNKFYKYIQEKAVTTTLYLSHHERAFLSNTNNEKSKIVYHTTNDKKEKGDEIDLEILKILANNARIPITDIAEKLKTTPRIIQYRIKELEKKEIILAYKVHLNPKEMNRIFCKAIIYLGNLNEQKLNKFMSYCNSLKQSLWPQRVLGNWDFELDLEVEDYDKFQDIILDIKEKFPDIIKNNEFCITKKEYKLDLFPGAYPTMILK